MNETPEPEARVYEPKIRRPEDDPSGGGLSGPVTRAIPEPVPGKSGKTPETKVVREDK